MIGFNISFVSKRIKNSKESLIQKSSFDWISETLTEDTEWNLPAKAYPVFVVKLRANGRGWPTTPNIVWCYMLLAFTHPVACCCAKFETGQTFNPVQTDATFTEANNCQ